LALRGAELKVWSETLATHFSSVSSAQSTIDVLSGVAAGTGVNQRVGRSIFVHQVHLYGTLVQGCVNLATDDLYNTFRMVLLETAQGHTPTISVDALVGPRLQDYLLRVLHDQTIILTSPGPNSVGYIPQVVPVDVVIRVNQRFDFGSAGTEPQLSLVMVSDSAAAANPGFTAGAVGVTFTDV